MYGALATGCGFAPQTVDKMILPEAYRIFKYWEDDPPTHLLLHSLLKGLSGEGSESGSSSSRGRGRNPELEAYLNEQGKDWRKELGDPMSMLAKQPKNVDRSTGTSPKVDVSDLAAIPGFPQPVFDFEEMRIKSRDRLTEQALKKINRTIADFQQETPPN